MSDTSRLGRYEIRREIARSNDIVYEAVDTLLGRRVALKELLLPPNLTGEAKRERVERFYREARAAGKLAHPNIVTIFEVSEDHDRHYIAMEYLEGETLRQLLDTGGALPVPRAVEILSQTLEALSYAHLNGVVHRDIKPDNIYLLTDGTVKLTDFGIARIMEEPSLTSAGQVFGTPSYMSPEQITGKPVDERTDLYSVGVMAYEMLTGRKPFIGENVVALTYQILNVTPSPPAGVGDALTEVIQKGMARDTAERYQSARQMIAALQDALGVGPGLQTPNLSGTFPPGSLQISSAGTVALDPNAQPIGGFTHNTPTQPPFSSVHRGFPFRLSEGVRQFISALAIGLLIGGLVVAGVLGVRAAYQNYTTSVRQQAAMAVYMEAVRAYNGGRYGDAIRGFQTTIQRASGTPLSKEAHHGMTQSYLQLGDAEMGRNLERAQSYYATAIRLDPQNPEPYLRMGDVLERLNHLDDAIAAWQRVIDLDGFGEMGMQARHQQAASLYNRGVDEFNVGNRVGAQRYWEHSIQVDPNGPLAGRAEQNIRSLFPTVYPGM